MGAAAVGAEVGAAVGASRGGSGRCRGRGRGRRLGRRSRRRRGRGRRRIRRGDLEDAHDQGLALAVVGPDLVLAWAGALGDRDVHLGGAVSARLVAGEGADLAIEREVAAGLTGEAGQLERRPGAGRADILGQLEVRVGLRDRRLVRPGRGVRLVGLGPGACRLALRRADDERIQGDGLAPLRRTRDDRDAVRLDRSPFLGEQHTGRLELGGVGVDRRHVPVVDVDLGLAARRPDRPDPGHGRTGELQRGLGLAGVGRQDVAAHVALVVGLLPIAAIGDPRARLVEALDRTGLVPARQQAVARRQSGRRRGHARQDEGDQADDHDPGGQDVLEVASPLRAGGLGGGGVAVDSVFVDPAGPVPECHPIVSPFGNPADYVSPVALRPRLATGVLFRGSIADQASDLRRVVWLAWCAEAMGRWSRWRRGARGRWSGERGPVRCHLGRSGADCHGARTHRPRGQRRRIGGLSRPSTTTSPSTRLRVWVPVRPGAQSGRMTSTTVSR